MIKPKPIAKLSNKGVPAFTILESLVTLGITCFMVMSLSGSLNGIFQSVEETLFFLSFENLYRDTQTLANVNQRAMTLTISEDAISNGVSKVSLPRQVKVGDTEQIVLSKEGGNSSLGKVVFQLQDKEIYYQLYLGSGKYKKQRVAAYILLESLVALGLMATITSLVLGEVTKSRQQMQASLHQQAVLNVATMAIQTEQGHLAINGVEVSIVEQEGELLVYEGKKRILHIKKD